MSMIQYSNLASKVFKYTKFYLGRFITEIGAGVDKKGSSYSEDLAYAQTFSRHRKISIINEIKPQISNSFIAENASVLGDVRINSYSNIGHNVVLRAEISPIR